MFYRRFLIMLIKKGNSTGIQFQKLVLHDISKPVNSEKFSDLFNIIRGPWE